MIVVETDLAAPQDVDRIRIQVTQLDRVLLDEDHEIGPGKLLLPAVFRLNPPGNSMPVVVRGLAFKDGEARIERSAVTPIPSRYLGRLRIPLNYLCDGTATPQGASTCGDARTCKQGSCASSTVPPSEVPMVKDSPDAGADAGPSDAMASDGSTVAVPPPGNYCFDVLACFAGAIPATIEEVTCSIMVPAGVDPNRLNVAIRLMPGSSGICNAEACWVALDFGVEGWTFQGSRIRLPENLCLPRSDGRRLAVAISTACGTKTAAAPPCGAWSSATTPIESPPPPPVTPACMGPMAQSCGNCGTQTRQCRDGVWQPWGACGSEGPCAPTSAQACGAGGMQLCGGTCRWGTCSGQTCTGPAGQSCGNCGTQTRTCDNGTWSAWSACAGEGACAPNSTEACEGNGLRSCGGSCQWSACVSANCVGVSTMACGNCGTRTRTCTPETGAWSDWSMCLGEGVCRPNDVMSCGSDGTKVCGGNCQWAAACTGQQCTGPAVEVCGRCGARSRVCESDTGTWTEWSMCMNEGSCQPGAMDACGMGGARTCGGTCQWNPCIELCSTGNGGCDPRTTCSNAGTGRVCGECPTGFVGTGLTGCTDVDECATAHGGCDPLTTCTNTVGSRSCGPCPAGYLGTGLTGCVPPAGTGGSSGAPGSGGTDGTGGIAGSGGRSGTGGASGGSAGIGGTPASGGMSATGGGGGQVATGGSAGTVATGGAVGTGGQVGSGGAPGTGGAGAGCPGTAGPAMVRMPQDYCIDVTEVTRAQYNAWLLTNPAPSTDPRCATNTSYLPGTEPSECAGPSDGPVVCVDWCDAFTYCQAAGKRLCGRIGGGANAYGDYANVALSQWYNACSSHGANVYPYSGAYAPTTCNGFDKGVGATVAAGSLPGCQSNVTGYAGVFDLSGNAFEWEDSCADGTANAGCRFRGGGYGSSMGVLRCDGISQATRTSQSPLIGFRCCAD